MTSAGGKRLSEAHPAQAPSAKTPITEASFARTPLDDWVKERIYPFGDLASYQLAKIQETVEYARTRSAYYRNTLADFDPGEIRSLSDFTKLPLTKADDIKADPFGFLAVSQDEIGRVVTLPTSGSTGAPKRVFFTQEDMCRIVDFFRHGMSTLVRRSDVVAIMLPWERPGSVGDLLGRALGQLGARAVFLGPVCGYREALFMIKDEGVTSLVGIPTQVLGMAKYAEGLWRGYSSPLRAALLTTDYVSPSLASAVERVLGCEVFNHYGMTEMGYGGGVDCEAHSGYHLREVDLYFEIVDSNTGIPVPPGAMGEIVFTTLTRKGMPLVRYATGDLGSLLPEACPCGSGLQRMSLVRDRVDGRVSVPGGGLSMSDLDDVLFSFPGIADFEAALVRHGTKADLRIRALYVDHPSGASVRKAESEIRREFPFIGTVSLDAQVFDGAWEPKKRMLKVSVVY